MYLNILLVVLLERLVRRGKLSFDCNFIGEYFSFDCL